MYSRRQMSEHTALIAAFAAVVALGGLVVSLVILVRLRSAAPYLGPLYTELARLRETQSSDDRAQRAELRESIEAFRCLTDKKLEEIRLTVDEKLQGTLEKRLGESFQLVSERLEQVHRGLGAMRQLASDVGGLQKVLANVKTRGGWGEVQLGNLLEQVLTADQYTRNVQTSDETAERVDFAIKLPGDENGAPVWLPIDPKFTR